MPSFEEARREFTQKAKAGGAVAADLVSAGGTCFFYVTVAPKGRHHRTFEMTFEWNGSEAQMSIALRAAKASAEKVLAAFADRAHQRPTRNREKTRSWKRSRSKR